MKRLLVMLCIVCLLPLCARATDTGAYLPADSLRALEPAYVLFLAEMADMLVAQDLLKEDEREMWMLYQLGDYYQNGGYGRIAVVYTPGMLYAEEDVVSMRRLTAETEAGVLRLDTLRRYAESYSALPGLPLDAELMDGTGAARFPAGSAGRRQPVRCSFGMACWARWSMSARPM